MSSLDDIHHIRELLEQVASDLHRLVAAVLGEAIGIVIEPGLPTIRRAQKVTKVNLKRTHGASSHTARAAGKGAVIDFVLQDNGDDTCTVLGVDSQGNELDISAVATLTPPPTSSDTTILTVDAPSGVTFTLHAVGKLSTPGTPVNVTATATWNDGSIGPFTFTLPVDVISGGATGIVIKPGVPTVH